MDHRYNDYGICVKCHNLKDCPGYYINPDNELENDMPVDDVTRFIKALMDYLEEETDLGEWDIDVKNEIRAMIRKLIYRHLHIKSSGEGRQ